MKNLRSLFVTLFFYVPVSLVSAQNIQPAKDSTGPQFTFINNDRVHDFGGVALYATVTYDVQFKNTGSQPLIITDMHCADNVTAQPPFKIQIKYPANPVKPGKKEYISVTFIAKGDVGSFKNEILVTSNATSDNYPLLLIFGAVTPTPHEGKKVTKEDMDGYFGLFRPVITNGK